jgi:hypothetical protein
MTRDNLKWWHNYFKANPRAFEKANAEISELIVALDKITETDRELTEMLMEELEERPDLLAAYIVPNDSPE